jgi:hypothetical protein
MSKGMQMQDMSSKSDAGIWMDEVMLLPNEYNDNDGHETEITLVE